MTVNDRILTVATVVTIVAAIVAATVFGQRRSSWDAANVVATDDCGVDAVVVYSVEIRTFATSNRTANLEFLG